MTETAILDNARQQEAKRYARIQRRWSLVDMGIGVAYLLAWLVFGWSAALRDALSKVTASPFLLVALYALVFGGIYFLIGLPLSYYTGFVLPHHFGQSTQTLRGWVADQLKSLPIAAVFGLLALEVIYLVLRSFPQTWWLWAAGFALVFSVLLSILAPVVLMPLFNKFVPLGEEYAELSRRLVALAEKAGTRVRGVYKFDLSRRTKSANAALTGLGATRRIILGDTLLTEFTTDEIETVLAHELGYHVHRDIPIGILFETVITLAGFWLSSLFLAWGARAFGFQGVGDIAGLPLLGIALGLYGLLTMPLTNGISRWRERRADEYALRATGNAPAFASALTRLANQNLSEVDPEPWVEWLFYSHPALGKRIRMARDAMK